jgi:hypothetical protein
MNIMAEDQEQRRGSFAAVALFAMVLFSLPYVVLGVGLLEESIWGTAAVAGFCRRLGIYEPLKSLLEVLRAKFGA